MTWRLGQSGVINVDESEPPAELLEENDEVRRRTNQFSGIRQRAARAYDDEEW